jgi:hypothetical protein
VTIGDLTVATAPVPIAGGVTVKATARAEADTTANAYGGGGIQVGLPTAESTISPDVDAFIGTSATAASPTRIYARGSVRVTAELLDSASRPITDALSGIDITNDTVTFSYPGIGEGDSVSYQGPGITGLHAGSPYTVIETGTAGRIRLGSLFDAGDAATVDPTTEVITFATPHGFLSGDCVIYDSRGGISILQSTATAACGTPGTNSFYVRVIPAPGGVEGRSTQIKLTTSHAAAVAATDAPLTGTVSGNTIVNPTLAGQPSGTAVIYRAPVAATFFSGAVDVTPVQIEDADGNLVWAPDADVDETTKVVTINHNSAANNIFLGTAITALLNDGDALLYLALGATPIAGLTSGHVYYVIKGANGVIRLADSYCHAVGCANPDGDDDTDDDIPVTALALGPGASDSLQHSLQRSIGGLRDGQTYYTRTGGSIPAGSVGLALAPTGGSVITLDGANRPGTHRFGIVEVDLKAGDGLQSLYADLSGTFSAPGQRLAGPGGEDLTEIAPPSGDGASGSTVNSGSGAVFDVGVPAAKVTGTVTVDA